MKLKDINLRKIDKAKLIEGLLTKEIESPSKKELKEIQKLMADSIDKGIYMIARNALTIGIFFDFKTTFDNIHRKGLFRFSKYVLRKCIVKDLAVETLEIFNSLSIENVTEKNYLESIINFSIIHESYNELQKYIKEEINKFERNYKGKSLVKTLLSYTDFLFLSNHYPPSITDLTEISSRTKEDLCSAASYIIFTYSEIVKAKKIDTVFVAEEFIKSGEIGGMLIAACFISDFKEFEIMIDHFQYNCSLSGENLKIEPPFENFEKSIRLGYIRTELQSYNDRIDAEEAVSMEQIVEEINKIEKFEFFQLTETHDYPRYRVELPEPVYDIIIDKFIKPDSLFKEEVIYLAQVFKEQLLTPADLKEIKVRDDLSLFEFIKIRRVFVIFYLFFAKEIYKKEKVESELLFRSLIPAYPEDTFYEFIEKLTSAENIDAFLDIVCWEPGSDILFDLQYHSILFFNNHFLIPLTVFVNSNSIRNLFASEHKQDNKGLLSDGTIDPLVDALNKSLSKAKINSYKQTPIPKSDIDLFAVYDDTIFIFECKHSLHPVSSFDLRTTHDYILKAEKQLDYVNDEFNNGTLISVLEKKHGIDLSGIKNIQSCIVLSNRLFNGNCFKYPVRNFNEIDNILNLGTMRTNEGEFWLWSENHLTLADLLEYFSLESKLVDLTINSLSKRTMIYPLANPKIEFDAYYMDSSVAIPKLNEFTSKLRKVENA